MRQKLILIIILSIFLISVISAICCEKTKAGAWCQDVIDETECDTSADLRAVPTSCEATSYCSLGCCYNSQQGTCTENTPQKVCEQPGDDVSGGVWSKESKECDIPQCSLGCCLIGEQAAFVTQTRCKRLASAYGLEISFRTDIQSEIECIANAYPSVKGACVFEKEFEKTCLFLTKKECLDLASSDSNVEFHEGFLCSAPELATNCGPTEQTKCVEGRDEVYFVDSCGNLANVYDASKWNNKLYWTHVAGTKDGVEVNCVYGAGNAGSKTCGNCDYYLGSTCKAYDRNKDGPRGNLQGDNICRDLACYEGNTKIADHGETWCATVSYATEGEPKIIEGENWDPSTLKYNFPGSRHFRLVCYNGDVTVEPCADYRQEICLQSSIGTEQYAFSTAACIVNMWQDCVAQDNAQDCNNIDRRDCKWDNSKCVPDYAPGFDFWNTEGDAESICSLGSDVCKVTYIEEYEGIKTEKDCEDNCECMPGESGHDDWLEGMENRCMALGDCGSKTNYLGVEGYESPDVITTEDVDKD